MKGKFIVFEGISGTGKETQASLLQNYLARKKIKSIIVFHPTTGIKPHLKKAKTIKDQLEILIRDRRVRVQRKIIPALKNGTWVISLRNYISAYVYQGDGSTIKKFEPVPDYIFYFDISAHEALKRVMKRTEPRGKYETLKLLNTKRKKYKNVLKKIDHIIIDARPSIDEVHKNVMQYIS